MLWCQNSEQTLIFRTKEVTALHYPATAKLHLASLHCLQYENLGISFLHKASKARRDQPRFSKAALLNTGGFQSGKDTEP